MGGQVVMIATKLWGINVGLTFRTPYHCLHSLVKYAVVAASGRGLKVLEMLHTATFGSQQMLNKKLCSYHGYKSYILCYLKRCLCQTHEEEMFEIK